MTSRAGSVIDLFAGGVIALAGWQATAVRRNGDSNRCNIGGRRGWPKLKVCG